MIRVEWEGQRARASMVTGRLGNSLTMLKLIAEKWLHAGSVNSSWSTTFAHTADSCGYAVIYRLIAVRSEQAELFPNNARQHVAKVHDLCPLPHS